jgi:hypothetical protein
MAVGRPELCADTAALTLVAQPPRRFRAIGLALLNLKAWGISLRV